MLVATGVAELWCASYPLKSTRRQNVPLLVQKWSLVGYLCDVTLRNLCSQDELSAHERNFTDALDGVDGGMDRAAADFRAIDSKTSALAAASATTGAHLLSFGHKLCAINDPV